MAERKMDLAFSSGELIAREGDIRFITYNPKGWEQLSPQEQRYAYALSELGKGLAPIFKDQNFRYNLALSELLSIAAYSEYLPVEEDEREDWAELQSYLGEMHYANGIHHPYTEAKLKPRFSRVWLEGRIARLKQRGYLLRYQGVWLKELLDILFLPELYPYRTVTNAAVGRDPLAESAVNYYAKGISTEEVEQYYQAKMESLSPVERKEPPSWGLNSYLDRDGKGQLFERYFSTEGKYREIIREVLNHWGREALELCPDEEQKKALEYLLESLTTGSLEAYNKYCIHWLRSDYKIDFILGFTETYQDPLGLRGSWEGIVFLRDEEASLRGQILSQEAAWFEQHSPIEERFKKPNPKGIKAVAVNALSLSGDAYPAAPIGVNLPNADWLRKDYGSKSFTIENLHQAIDDADRAGLLSSFITDPEVLALVERYGSITERLHTDMHECLGHGSGMLLEGVTGEELGPWGATIEEARADLFALYFMADEKMLELGLLDDPNAYKALYYQYILKGAVLQLGRITPKAEGNELEESHMRNRALISRYALDRAADVLELDHLSLKVSDYARLREVFGELLREIQRIKSTGDRAAAEALVRKYGISIDPALHRAIYQRYQELGVAAFTAFVNPDLLRGGYPTIEEQIAPSALLKGRISIDEARWEALAYPSALSEEETAMAKALRESLRRSMDGVVAQSMREKGLHYGINFGLTRDYIERLSAQYQPSYTLASYLYSRDVRELKLIGQRLFPLEEVDETTALYLAYHSGGNPELRDYLAMDLLEKLPYMKLWALGWLLAKPQQMLQLVQTPEVQAVAWISLARIVTRGVALELTEALQAELLERASLALESSKEVSYPTALSSAAALFLKRYGRVNASARAKILELLAELTASDSATLSELVEDIQFSLDMD